MKIVLATRNPGKIEELRRILTDVDVVGLADYPDAPEVAETELTFAGNALLKARAVAAHTRLAAVADDSGLCVDALNGMPGVFSARWAGRHGDDRANLELLLDQIGDVPPALRGAHFACAAAVALPDGTERVVTGRIDGRIIDTPRGTGGFGYDPIFVPDGESRTTAEMPPAEKDAISHRGRAFRVLAKILPELVDP
ncbi:MAG TPA: RdgB/HAM1 family non-canonical purine NTP pyrophosphatase [Streptosporangiaceae bacterium]|nr:RdgB/HAM1 family non-canonical purine NTP pyrophosphatase [Streptosporangiaceae bacterium]